MKLGAKREESTTLSRLRIAKWRRVSIPNVDVYNSLRIVDARLGSVLGSYDLKVTS